ncbi:ribosome-recycling factor, mitochondrial-like [Uloborus diversus]|uniref:ribosome-recycling factor, mitochondrial-like n=1 Tax=Uloborus diversus TaxID=327109 RepID=UPI002409E064|nr:ribosome-recycling factor, mitochondrial-like [Uloborus diversus]XP_054711321.1 ribosome-recycling factor, mitochondrial-like [Uloborus diversus]
MEQLFKLRKLPRHLLWVLENQKSFKHPAMSRLLTERQTDVYRNVPTLFSGTFSCLQIRNYAKKAQGKSPKGGKLKTMHLSDEEMANVIDIDGYRRNLQHVSEQLKKDYAESLSLRSTGANIENLLVKIEDEEHSLHELAQISKKNQNLIAINLSDFPEALKPAMQAILETGSGLNPQQEGTMIYVSIPKLTREHRETLAKNARTLFVKAKDDIRAVQNQYMKEAKRKTDLSEDLVFATVNQIMAIAEQCNGELEKLMKTKQKELLGDS